MSEIQSGRVVRVNTFTVPAQSRAEFMRLLVRTHDIIRAEPGFITDMILERQNGMGDFNILAILEFEGEHVLQPITAKVAKSNEEAGIDRHAISRRLGVEGEINFYFPAVMPEPVPA